VLVHAWHSLIVLELGMTAFLAVFVILIIQILLGNCIIFVHDLGTAGRASRRVQRLVQHALVEQLRLRSLVNGAFLEVDDGIWRQLWLFLVDDS